MSCDTNDILLDKPLVVVVKAALHTALTEYSTAVHKLGSPNPLPHKLKSKIIRISESAACSLEKCLQIILKQVDEIGCFTEQ